MWIRLRRGHRGGYHHLATLEDNEENYLRMVRVWGRLNLHRPHDYARIVRLTSLYQDEKLPLSGAYVNRANKRHEKKLQRVFDKHVEKQNRKLQKYVAAQPLFDPTAVPVGPETTPDLA